MSDLPDWITSDPHFFHKQVIEYEGPRKWINDVDQMNAVLIKSWNAYVRPTDRITVLGDFSFAAVTKTTELLSQLNGRKRLILGNHDFKYKPDKWIKMGFESSAYSDEIEVDGIRITMSHFPLPVTWWQKHILRWDDRYRKFKIPNEGQWHLNGHVHSKWKTKGKQINVGVDAWNLRPVHLSEIMSLIKA